MSKDTDAFRNVFPKLNVDNHRTRAVDGKLDPFLRCVFLRFNEQRLKFKMFFL